MDLKECLTNEKIRKKFNSQFELVNYAIRLAENMIKSGREPRVKTDSKNRALQILSEILNNKDRFDDIIVSDVSDAASLAHSNHEYVDAAQTKTSDKKKPRKAQAK